MLRLKCAEIWGGVKDEELDVCAPGLTMSLYSSACNGGKGGDIYYYSICRGNRMTRIAIADVTGHGTAVSEIGSWVHTELADKMDDPTLVKLFVDLNRRVASRGLEAITTAVAMSYDALDKRMEYGYAGHPPILARRGGVWEALPHPRGNGRQNLPLGVDPNCLYRTGALTIDKGDLMLLYTDGVLEAPAPGGEQFGPERLRALVSDNSADQPHELKTKLLHALQTWTAGNLSHDDVTFLAIEVSRRDPAGRAPAN